MRKLGDRLGMTAANIYNYYANKSELYLDIQTRGFLLLNESFAVVLERTSDPVERLVGFAWAYVDFGLTHKDYYDVMLGRNTPKYTDYVGTALEPVARREKETAVAVIDLVERVISTRSTSATFTCLFRHGCMPFASGATCMASFPSCTPVCCKRSPRTLKRSSTRS